MAVGAAGATAGAAEGGGFDPTTGVEEAGGSFDQILDATRELNDQLIQQKFDAAVEQNIAAGEQSAVDAVKKN